jgi:ubiquinone/menaquinone biosynthesis C-methylase UbiE
LDLDKINNYFGDLDIYLLDQILKGSFNNRHKLLDIGCGEGRNLLYFLQSQAEVHGVDLDESSIEICKLIAQRLNQPISNFRVADAKELPYPNLIFDAVISCNLLHYATTKDNFIKMWGEQNRVLKRGGLLYINMDSALGNLSLVKQIDDHLWQFLDGTTHFLLTHDLLAELEINDHFRKLDFIKTVQFENQHAHTILVLEKQ